MISRSLFDFPELKCIPVIASFSNKGEVKPLYATVNGIQLKIADYTIHNRVNEKGWLDFHCEVIDQNTVKQIVLIFNTSEHAWFVHARYFRE